MSLSKFSFLTPKQALQKIKSFCTYQERSHYETKGKLYEFGLNSKEIDEIIATLIQENYLNEERFATQFVGGKFRVKQWGKIKIKYEIQQHQVSPYNLKKAFQQIDEDDYLALLDKLCQAHYSKQKGTHLAKSSKTKMYLQQKGFELNLIYQALYKQKTSSK